MEEEGLAKAAAEVFSNSSNFIVIDVWSYMLMCLPGAKEEEGAAVAFEPRGKLNV